MKTRLRINLLIWISFLLMIVSCSKEVPETNLSAVNSISVDARDVIIPSFIIDRTGKYLIVCIRDLNFKNGIVKKINLNSFKVEAEFTVRQTVPISLTNILLTDNNDIVTTFFNFENGVMLIYKFDINLNVVKLDTVAFVPGGNFGRRRMVKIGPNLIKGAETNRNPVNGKIYLRYMTMDDGLNILSEMTDSSNDYGTILMVPQQFIQTMDGGTMYMGENYDQPFFYEEIIMEKRDANFNLLWRTKFKNNGNNSASCLREYNGKFYVWSHGQDENFQNKVFMLVYDQQGNLIENKTMPNEATISKDAENMIITENGDFLMLALTTLNSSSNINKGILFHSNSAMDNITYKTFGGEGGVQVSALIPIGPNRYMLMYIDRSFTPDASQPRLVFRYVDSKGNFIE